MYKIIIIVVLFFSCQKDQSFDSVMLDAKKNRMNGDLMKSITLFGSNLLSVVHTIPTGLLKAKYMFFCLVDFSIL